MGGGALHLRGRNECLEIVELGQKPPQGGHEEAQVAQQSITGIFYVDAMEYGPTIIGFTHFRLAATLYMPEYAFDQRASIEGLRDEIIHPRCNRLLSLADVRARGQTNDGHVDEAPRFTDFPGCGVAIEFRHLYVHEHDIKICREFT